VPPAAEPQGLTVVELIAAYLRHARDYYAVPGGAACGVLGNIRDAVRPLRKLYGLTPAAAFGPLALKAVRKEMVGSGLARSTVNRRVGRIKRMFRWAVGNDMVPPAVARGLAAVEGLRTGRGACARRGRSGRSPTCTSGPRCLT
jgi:hypothetical protein